LNRLDEQEKLEWTYKELLPRFFLELLNYLPDIPKQKTIEKLMEEEKTGF